MTERPTVSVLCPAATISGGPEALHQFAGALREKGVDSAMVYYPGAPEQAVPAPYQRYGVAVRPVAEDGADTVVIIPEVVTSLAWRFPLAKKAIWWLSIDNYFKWRHLNPGPSVLDPRAGLMHLCQSYYARDFLSRRRVAPLSMLTDFLTDDAFTLGPAAGRVPVAAYNAKRLSEPQRRLMDRVSDRIWLPLEHMTKAELADVLREVRLYVDFGAHPGRDRMPREAALCGAVVLTGRQGAAGFAEDVPIPERFRLDETMPDFESRAAALVGELLSSDLAFQEAWSEQAAYRDWIGHNKDVFIAEVEAFIRTIMTRRPSGRTA